MRLGLKLGLDISRSLDKSIPLLDQFPEASAAYSLRYLSSSYAGDVVLVRRSSDNTELGFTPNEIADGTLTEWTGANNGFVKTWYDQSGNNMDATQTTTTLQPQIVSSGSLITDNSKPAIDSSGGKFLISTSLTTSLLSVFSVHNEPLGSGLFPYLLSIGNKGIALGTSSAPDERYFWDSTSSYTFGSSTNAQELLSFFSLADSPFISAFENTVEQTFSGSPGVQQSFSNTLRLGTLNNSVGSTNSRGKKQELILYSSDQSANRASIEAEINSYYSIY